MLRGDLQESPEEGSEGKRRGSRCDGDEIGVIDDVAHTARVLEPTEALAAASSLAATAPWHSPRGGAVQT